MRRLLILSIIASGALFAGPYSEPSVYVEEQPVDDPNTKTIKSNQNAIVELKRENSELRQDVEGLKSIIEGLNVAVNELRQSNASKSVSQPTGGADAKLVKDLGVMIDKINGDYVSKAELAQALRGRSVAPAPRTTTTTTHTTTVQRPAASSNPLESASSSALFSRGVRLVGQHKYSMAKQRFDILRARGYKKAATYYYSGEVAYRQGKYSNAIGYYKISAGANDKANYMPTLLLHTGISMEKTGQKKQAKNFFRAIIDSYPGTYSAKEAKKHL